MTSVIIKEMQAFAALQLFQDLNFYDIFNLRVYVCRVNDDYTQNTQTQCTIYHKLVKITFT